ncbi:MAG: NAD kinase [Micrococcales bacterium]
MSRNVLLVPHTGRDEALSATLEAIEGLIAAGLTVAMDAKQLTEAKLATGSNSYAVSQFEKVRTLGDSCALADIEVAMVFGGDGTILRAAELVRAEGTPLLGVNLGHVGFLAESERPELSEAVSRIVKQDYVIRERLTLDVVVLSEGREVYRTWALNEATVEKSRSGKMLEVVVEIDSRPLTSFGCDGIVMATPTGSTAYAFSAGGPVIWPSVEALMLIPLSAHALFSKPLVVNPDSLLAVEVLQRSSGHGTLWADGRRTFELPPGARVEVRRSSQPVRLARLRTGSFTDRLVNKFGLPVTGWRGPEA